jgi:hypothetical protein
VLSHTNAHTEAVSISLAEAVPEDKCTFAPTNGEFKSVRTLVTHVAADYLDGAALLREKRPVDFVEHENGPDSIRKKAQNLEICSGLLRLPSVITSKPAMDGSRPGLSLF